MLRSRADRRTLVYMAAATLVAAAQWGVDSFQPLLFCAAIALACTVSQMHHNHQHQPLWKSAALNRATDLWFTLFQGHPGFVFGPSHRDNHHVHRNGALDYTRTWRGHDGNSLVGLIAHPAQFAAAIAPVLLRHLGALWREQRGRFWEAVGHYAALSAVLAAAFCADPARAVLFVVLPQLCALFVLLGSNYLQHAHTDERSRWSHSRNFLGLINPLCFNVGYHTAHHEDGDLHWSELPAAHARIAGRIDARLIEPGFFAYCLRVFVLGPFVPRWRSVPLRRTA